jgi:hypothetical protein
MKKRQKLATDEQCGIRPSNSEVAQDARIIPRLLLFCERMQNKRQLGIRAFFIFGRCERNTVLVAGIRIVYLRPGLLKLRLTEFDNRAEAKTIARLRELKAKLRLC